MHTSLLTKSLFFVGIGFAITAHIINFALTLSNKLNLRLRRVVPLIGIAGIVAAGFAGWRASIDWAHLPKLTANSPPGTLYDDGGVPAIVEKQSP